MSNTAKDTQGVHRLLDMVVEEVSLVDRAANQHRFLIVKRDDSMNDTTQVNKAPKGSEGNTPPATAAGALNVPDDSPLGAALAALESLTSIVDLLGSLGAERSDTRLAALAQQLRTTAEQILAQTGFPVEPPPQPHTPEAQAKATAPASPPPAADSALAKSLAAATSALNRLSEFAARSSPARAEKRQQPPPSSDMASLQESIAKLAESVRTLTDTVREQQQRLGRVEKHFGMPNSAAPAERVSKAEDEEDVGWPLDLNKPMGREHIDKSVSFHDL
jgi:hypothetical protein